MIGHLGSLIKQLSNPFANLAEQAKKVTEINALVAIYPSFERKKKGPCRSIDLGGGFLLLGPKDKKPFDFSPAEQTTLNNFYLDLSNVEPIPQ